MPKTAVLRRSNWHWLEHQDSLTDNTDGTVPVRFLSSDDSMRRSETKTKRDRTNRNAQIRSNLSSSQIRNAFLIVRIEQRIERWQPIGRIDRC